MPLPLMLTPGSTTSSTNLQQKIHRRSQAGAGAKERRIEAALHKAAEAVQIPATVSGHLSGSLPAPFHCAG